MRINKIITKEKKALIFYQILSTHSLRKYIEISLENLYVDIGSLRVNSCILRTCKGIIPPSDIVMKQ